jgi:hypothetical protein
LALDFAWQVLNAHRMFFLYQMAFFIVKTAAANQIWQCREGTKIRVIAVYLEAIGKDSWVKYVC